LSVHGEHSIKFFNHAVALFLSLSHSHCLVCLSKKCCMHALYFFAFGRQQSLQSTFLFFSEREREKKLKKNLRASLDQVATSSHMVKTGFLTNTDKYSAVCTKYLVPKYLADHYSAEYWADRIVGCSLFNAHDTLHCRIWNSRSGKKLQ
jgi:hypothetical protein